MDQAKAYWDYLVVTASNAAQAQAYEEQLGARRQLGLLPEVGEAFVVPDLEGKRIGSGGSTLYCLMEILRRERARSGVELTPDGIRQALTALRILIVHAGGDSRRLPAYAPCGKIFVPLPGESDSPLPLALFDLLVPSFLAMPAGREGAGQVLVAAGDALIQFDPSCARLAHAGMVALGVYATPEEASRHGVFALGADGEVVRYLQKPSIETQRAAGVLGPKGTPLDIGVIHMDGATATSLLFAFGARCNGDVVDFKPESLELILEHGLDLFREICCGLGSRVTFEHYRDSARAAGSNWGPERLRQAFPALNKIPFHAELAPQCRFLHFGSTRQLTESGAALTGQEAAPPALLVNSVVEGEGRVAGADAWLEGCRIAAPLTLAGQNVAVGVDVPEALSLPRGACLETLRGVDRGGKPVRFVRCYGIGDTFKHAVSEGGTFCGAPLALWLETVGVAAETVWPEEPDPKRHSLWNARVFPAVAGAADYRAWLWMFQPETATSAQKAAFAAADRYSAAEIAVLTDQRAFHARRLAIWKQLLAARAR